MSKPTITAEALAMARDHPLAADEPFLLQLSESLARLHHTATSADRIGVLNRVTAEQVKRADADENATARTEAALAERNRIEAILTSPEAKGRETVAQALAFQSDMPAAAAIAALATAPKASPLTSWATQPAQPAEPIEGLVRSADAPGGLIATDPKTGEPVAGIVGSDPTPPRKPTDPAKAMWKQTIAGINRETGGATAAK